MRLPYYDAETVHEVLTYERAMDALEESLRGGLDPEADGPRLFADAPGGEFLLMPASSSRYAGLKALTVAPDNPARGLEKIQGVYVLYSADTLAPVALMDGASMTVIRTSAVSISAVRQLAALAPDDVGPAPRILVFGAGSQAAGHIRAAHVSFPGARFEVVGRRPERVAALASDLAGDGITITDRTADGEAAVPGADIIVCVTTASGPIFDGALVSSHAIVAAAGTHGRDMRELDDGLVGRADIVVEGRASARAENGNLVSLTDAQLAGTPNLADLARGHVQRTPGRPVVYTGVGMSWEDLVCASAIHEELS